MEYFDVLNKNGEFTEKTGPWNFLKNIMRWFKKLVINRDKIIM